MSARGRAEVAGPPTARVLRVFYGKAAGGAQPGPPQAGTLALPAQWRGSTALKVTELGVIWGARGLPGGALLPSSF